MRNLIFDSDPETARDHAPANLGREVPTLASLIESTPKRSTWSYMWIRWIHYSLLLLHIIIYVFKAHVDLKLEVEALNLKNVTYVA